MSIPFEKDTAQAWKERIIKELKGAPFEKVVSQTNDGIEVQPFYVHENRDSILNTGPSHPWSIHQEFHDQVENKNSLILQALGAGVDSIALTCEDLEKDLKDVVVDIIDIEIGGEDFHMLWPEFLESRGLSPKKMKGGYDFDPFGSILQTGALQTIEIIPMVLNVFATATKQWPDWRLLNIAGDRYANAGATPVQELAYTLAQIKTYLDIDSSLCKEMSVVLSADTLYFESACKFRAFRILWANLLKAYSTSGELSIKARSGTRDLAPTDQHGNLLRATSQGMAAVIGGADKVELRPFNGRGDAFSFRLARNIQKLLVHESYFDKNLNPMKGAYLFEEMSKEMAMESWRLFKDIESKGGWLHFVKEGYIQKMVHRSAESYAEAINNKKSTWLGMNLYPDEGEKQWKELNVEFDGRSLPVLESRMA